MINSDKAFAYGNKTQSEVFPDFFWIGIRSEYPIPKCKKKSEILGRKALGPVVNTVKIRRDENLLQEPEVNPKIGVNPNIDKNACGECHTCFRRSQVEKVVRKKNLGNCKQEQM
jgi:hypothetical protein